jgi:molecular chaperone IbpA
MTQFSINTFDLPTLHAHIHRHAVGFDRMFDDLNRTFANTKTDGNYPPYNIIKVDENNYAIQVAVAGFSDDELDVECKENTLTISGERKIKDEQEYLHRGISARNFTRSFTLADHVNVKAATVINGILAISLEHVVPEEQKAKKIAITYAK